MTKKQISIAIALATACVAQAGPDMWSFDADIDGKLSKAEYIKFQAARGKDKATALRYFGRNDLDGDGFITKEELAKRAAKAG